MSGSTFTTSPIGRRRRRTGGPALSLIEGSGGPSRTRGRDARPVHPAQAGFTPDGVPSDARRRAVQASGPWSSPVLMTSRGSTSPDVDGVATTGSGPTLDRGVVLDALADVLASTDGDAPTGPDRHLRALP